MGPGAAFYQQVLFPSLPDTAANVGTGAGVFRNKASRNFNFRTLKSNTSALVITVAGDEVQFTLNFPPMLNYKGSWNAITNTPDLTTGSHAVGDTYDVSAADPVPSNNTTLDGINDWAVGDLVVRFDTGSGQAWKKFDNTDKIVSVNGQTGVVALTTDDIPEGTNKYYDDALVSANADVAANTAARHTHSNFALLETYTQSNANIADAVTKRHVHANLALLSTYTQTEADLADAVTKKHAHSNFALLETYTLSNANLTDAYNHATGGISGHNDIDFTTPPAHGQALVFNNTSGKWEPGTVSSGSGGGNILIYDPSAAPSGNVFDDIDNLLAAGAAIPGPKVIVARNAASPTSPIVIPVGISPYDFKGYTITADDQVAAFAGGHVEFADGASCTHFFDAVNTRLVFQNTSLYFLTFAGSERSLHLGIFGEIENLGGNNVIQIGIGATLSVFVDTSGYGLVPTNYEIFGLGHASGTLAILVRSKGCQFFVAGADLVRGTVGTYNLLLYNGDVNGSTNANFSGTFNLTEYNYKSTGGGGASDNIAVYDPDIGATTGNRYKTWGEVMTQVSAWGVIGGKILVRKAGIFQTATVPAGTYDLSRVWITSSADSLLPVLAFDDGTTLSGFPRVLEAVILEGRNTSAPLHTVAGFGICVLQDGSIRNGSTATQPVLSIPTGGNNFTMTFNGGTSPLYKNGGGSEPVFVEGTLSINIWRLPDNSFFSQNDLFTNGLSGNGSINITSHVLLPGGYEATHSNYDGTFNLLQKAEARVSELISTTAQHILYFDDTVTPGGNYYDNFDNLYAAIQALSGKLIVVYFNITLGNYTIPTPQLFDFGRCIFIDVNKLDTPSTLDFPDGSEISQWPLESDLGMIFNNTTIPVSQTSVSYPAKYAYLLRRADIVNNGTQPVFRTANAGDNFFIIMRGNAQAISGTIFESGAAGGTLRVTLFDRPNLGNVFNSVASAAINIDDYTLIDGGVNVSGYGSGVLNYSNEREVRINQVAEQRLADIPWRISNTTTLGSRLLAGSSTQLLDNAAISAIGNSAKPYFPRKFGFYSNLAGLTTLHGIHPSVATGSYADGMVITIENAQIETSPGLIAIEIKHNSGTAVANGKVFTQDGQSLWLYQNDKVKLRYNNNGAFGTVGWYVIAVERAISVYTGTLAGLTWTATVAPTVLSTNYALRFEGGYCYLDAYIECNGASGTNITQIIFNTPQVTPKSVGHAGNGRIGTLVDHGGDYLTGFTSACIAHAGDAAVQAAFPAISNPNFLRFSIVIPLDGSPVQ